MIYSPDPPIQTKLIHDENFELTYPFIDGTIVLAAGATLEKFISKFNCPIDLKGSELPQSGSD